VFELALQGLALAAPRLLARAPQSGVSGGFRILCIGDSHTYGWQVERSESYPARLAVLLNAEGETEFEVVNLGVPSSNSSQVVARLARYLAHYRPQLLILTIGANDVVNFADPRSANGESGLAGVLWHLRSWRLLAFALHQREKVGAGRDANVDVSWRHPWREVRLDAGGLRERFDHRLDFDAMLDEAEHEVLLRANLEEIVRIANRAGVPVVFASYTHGMHSLGTANRVMSETPDALFVSQLARGDLDVAVPPHSPGEEPPRLFFDDLHPKAPVYAAAAENLHVALVRAGLLPNGRPSLPPPAQ